MGSRNAFILDAMPRAGHSGLAQRAVLLVVFTLSGAAGLIYEVLWTRRLTHIFGSTTLAVSTVLAAFMGGLALGSYLLGAWADRNREKALRAYAVLEIAIALLGLAVPLLLRAVEAAYLGLAPALEKAPMVFFVAQFLLVGLVLILPCVLMGGTLPILARWLVGREDEIGGRIGTLYAANTFGAAAGTAAATYVLLPRAGVRRGRARRRRDQPRRRPDHPGDVPEGAIGRVPRGARPVPPKTRPGARRPRRPGAPGFSPRSGSRVSPAWSTRSCGPAWSSLVFGSTVYAFGLMLLLFLVGIAIGSAIFSRMRRADPVRVLGLSLIGNTAAALLGIAAVPHLPTWYMRGFPAVRDSFSLQQLCRSSRPPPCSCRSRSSSGSRSRRRSRRPRTCGGMGRGVGRVTAWNTVGTVGGAFLGGFVLIPRLGLRATLTVAAAATAVGGVLRAAPRSGSPSGRAPGLRRGRGGARGRAPAPGLAAEPPGAGGRLLRRDPAARSRRSSTPRAIRDPLLQGRNRDDALGRPAGALPVLPLQRQDRRVDRAGRHGQPAPPGAPADAGPPGAAGRLRARPGHRRLRRRDRAVPGDVDRHRGHRGGGPRGDAVLRAGEPRRPLGPARAVPRRRRPQRPPRAQGHLRRDPLGSLRRLGRGRGQPLHAGVLRARALAPAAGRRHGAVVSHALAAAGGHEADRRDVSLRVSPHRLLAPEPGRRDPARHRRADALGHRAAARARGDRPGRLGGPPRDGVLAASLDLLGVRPGRRRPVPDARGRPRPPLRRPARHRVPHAAGWLRDTTAINDAGIQALQTKPLPAIAGFEAPRDLDARANTCSGSAMRRSAASTRRSG